MKKFFILLSLLALPFAFVSCGGDDDNNSFGKMLQDPEFKALAAKYFKIKKAEGNNAGKLQEIADEIILKFGEDGQVWIYSKNGAPIEDAEACDDPNPNGANINMVPSLKGTDQWYVYVGQYKAAGENTYQIEGVGKVEIDGNNINLHFGEQAIMGLVAQLMTGLDANDLVSKACRSWVIRQTQVQVSGGDLKDTFGKFYKGSKAGDLTYIAQSIDQEEDLQSVRMAENLQEADRYTQIQTVTLSRSGVLEIAYANGKKDIATLTKISPTGDVELQWNGAELSNKYINGDLGIKAMIQNNYLVLTFQSEVVVEDVVEPYDVMLQFVMEWAK